MTVLKLDLPENLKITEFDLKMMIASRMYEQGQLTSGQAANVVGLSKKTFVELLGKYGISIFGYEEEELLEDLSNA